MRIMYLVSTLGASGPTNQLFNLVTNLDKKKYTPIIITLSPEPSNTLIDEFIEKEIKVKSLSLSRLKGLFKAKKKLNQIIKAYKPDIIHSQGLRPDSLVTNYLNEYKNVITLRNYPYEDYPMKYGNLLGNLMAMKHTRIIKKAKNPIACSFALKDKFKKKLNLTINSIQNGVDELKYYPVSNNEKINLRKKLGIPLDKNIFITVGSLIKRKAPQNIIKAFINIKEINNSFLYIIGEGPLTDECKQLYTGKNIAFLGSIVNVNEYLQASDIFISASRSEGLPNTVLESLSVGLPVCLSDIKPHIEILELGENAGTIFETDNIKDLTNRLNKILKKDYLKMRNSAIQIINSHLSAKKMASKYELLYSDINSNST